MDSVFGMEILPGSCLGAANADEVTWLLKLLRIGMSLRHPRRCILSNNMCLCAQALTLHLPGLGVGVPVLTWLVTIIGFAVWYIKGVAAQPAPAEFEEPDISEPKKLLGMGSPKFCCGCKIECLYSKVRPFIVRSVAASAGC